MARDSLLTESFRDMLEEQPEPDDYTRKKRMRMRNRIVEGLHDLALFNQYARVDDIEQIFHRDDTDSRPNGNGYLPDQRDDLLKYHWVPAYHAVALLWRGLRLNGMDKDDIFQLVITHGIEKGEADFHGVSRGVIESDISLGEINVCRDAGELDPLEKWERDLSLTGGDIKELHNRLSEHPDVDKTVGKDLGELINRHLIESDE